MTIDTQLKALIVEDDPDVAESVSLCLQLRWAGITATVSVEGGNAVDLARTESFDVVILDINLPDISGFEVLKRIRRFSHVPIIIVSVRGSTKDQVRGLDMGADDYIVKPFRPADLTARVNAVLRRSQLARADAGAVEPETRTVISGRISLSLANDSVTVDGKTIELSRYESRLLHMLMQNEGKPLNTRAILDEVWERRHSDDYLISTYVRRLRDKLGDNPPRMIVPQGGGGYRFVSPS